MLNAPQFVAVDVSKAMLDMAAPDGAWRTPNSLSGITALQKRLARYERPSLVDGAGEGSVHPVNPLSAGQTM